MLSSSTSRFDSMPVHPPTPPRDISKAVDDAIGFLHDSHEIERALNKPLPARKTLQAAALSPATSQDSVATSTSQSKKVGFSSHAILHQPSERHAAFPSLKPDLKRSPSARSTKPLKSILKSTHAPPLTPDDLDTKLSYFSPDVPGSFGKMLHSVISQLGGDSISGRLDAYMALNGALQAYDNVPDAAALVQNLGLITQFVSRDIAWKNANGRLNTNIAVQALKLTNFFLFSDPVAAALDADFRSFLVDRSIVVLESTEFPKQVVKTHIHLLALPRLQSPAMTASRADRVLTALQTIDQRCSGNNVIAARLVIYQRLLEQLPNLMINRMRDWLEQTLHCMLSSVSEVRGRALDTCFKGANRLGTQAHAAKAVGELLDTEIEEGRSYYEHFSTKLLEMLSDKELAHTVPRIWSALVLYFRTKRRPLEKWNRFKSWLTVIQKCLNSSEISVRYEATLAWNKLVYATTFENSLSLGMMKMLRTPVVSGIERRGNDPFTKQIRQYSMDCYCNLLHYALRPGVPAEELENGWKIFIEPILSPMANASPKSRSTACRILCGMMNGKGGAWNSNAALMPAPIKPEELPKLDPRWVRSHVSDILKILRPAFLQGLWARSELSRSLESIWLAIMQTVADAGSQEVRTSSDLKQAIAILAGFLRQLWSNSVQPSADGDRQIWYSNYVSMVEVMIRTIGAGHFVDDYLTTSDGEVVEVAPTPSMRRSKHHGAPQSPILVILRPFVVSAMSFQDHITDYWTSVKNILDGLTASSASTVVAIDRLSRTYFSLESISDDGASISTEAHLWETVSQCMTATLGAEAIAQTEQPVPFGQTLRCATEVLSAGLRTSSAPDPSRCIAPLYDAMFDLARNAAGEAGTVLAVIEPFAKAVAEASDALSPRRLTSLTFHILSRPAWPESRQTLESGRKALWGAGLAPHKAGPFDPYNHLYALLRNALVSGYTSLETDDADEWQATQQLFRATISFLQKAPSVLLCTSLRQIQAGFAVWIEDTERKTKALYDASELLLMSWTALLQLIQGVPRANDDILRHLEPLIAAGLASPHREVVNKTIVFWNARFGTQETLQYPARLESILRARMIDADLVLPTFPESNADHVPAELSEFYEADSQSDGPAEQSKPAARLRGSVIARRPQPAQSEYFTAQKSPAARTSTVSKTITRRTTASSGSTPQARLRHDDSQVQFAPIDSSPLRFDDESQHLTEHQREVRMRQTEVAQMFSDMSSSPMGQSTALPRRLSKRLDFSSDAQMAEANDPGTPTALPDTTGLMSDDLPSSPTPSTTRDARPAVLDGHEDRDTDDEDDEPPTSPPKRSGRDGSLSPARHQYMVGPDDTTVGVTDFVSPEQQAKQNAAAEPAEDPIDLPSDTNLPTEQLQNEANAAESTSQSFVAAKATVEDSEEAASKPTSSLAAEGAIEDVTRVEDSFVGDAEVPPADDQNAASTPRSRRTSRKRKRSASVTSSAKKQKSASPLKRFFSRIWSASQQDEDEEDVGEEIVVASSQRAESPESTRVPQTAINGSQQDDARAQVTQPAAEIVQEQEAMAPPQRRRGRPRKSETPAPSVGSPARTEVIQTRSLKRKSSALSTNGDTRISTSFIKDTPAPPKGRKGREGHGESQESLGSAATQSSQLGRKTRRTATAVMVSPPRPDIVDDVERVDEDVRDEQAEVATRKDSPAPTAAPAQVEERPKLTPKSILGRLRDLMSDLVGINMNAAEAREMDDVLYEFRREAFEAERRSRMEGGQ